MGLMQLNLSDAHMSVHASMHNMVAVWDFHGKRTCLLSAGSKREQKKMNEGRI